MTVETFTAAPLSEATNTEAEDLDHVACDCDFDTAFCGTDVSAAEWAAEDEEWRLCVVCVDLYERYQDIGVCCPKDPAVDRG